MFRMSAVRRLDSRLRGNDAVVDGAFVASTAPSAQRRAHHRTVRYRDESQRHRAMPEHPQFGKRAKAAARGPIGPKRNCPSGRASGSPHPTSGMIPPPPWCEWAPMMALTPQRARALAMAASPARALSCTPSPVNKRGNQRRCRLGMADRPRPARRDRRYVAGEAAADEVQQQAAGTRHIDDVAMLQRRDAGAAELRRRQHAIRSRGRWLVAARLAADMERRGGPAASPPIITCASAPTPSPADRQHPLS